MPLKPLRTLLVVPFALAGALAVPAFAQDEGGDPVPAPIETPKVETKPKVEEAPPEVRGNRYRITLKSGAKLEGILPQGVAWEKRDQFGEFVEATETEKGAGLRVNYVLNMEGDIFVPKKDIEEVKDLGALTDEQKLVIREAVLKDRKKRLEEKERINREEMAKIAAASREEDAAAEAAAKKGEKVVKKPTQEDKDKKRGDDLLKKFPTPDWGPQRIEEIKRRSIINGIFPTTDEQEFIDNFDLWKAAVARRDAEEAAGGGGEGDAGEGGGDEHKDGDAEKGGDGGDAKKDGDMKKGKKKGYGDKKESDKKEGGK